MKYLHQQNMKLVIFDFDGTIADTSEGILDSHRFALKAMGREVPCEEELRGVIGGNLLKTYSVSPASIIPTNEVKGSGEKGRRIDRRDVDVYGISHATLAENTYE